MSADAAPRPKGRVEMPGLLRGTSYVYGDSSCSRPRNRADGGSWILPLVQAPYLDQDTGKAQCHITRCHPGISRSRGHSLALTVAVCTYSSRPMSHL
jgi:hypothetical protein